MSSFLYQEIKTLLQLDVGKGIEAENISSEVENDPAIIRLPKHCSCLFRTGSLSSH